jgi:beta-glucosidase
LRPYQPTNQRHQHRFFIEYHWQLIHPLGNYDGDEVVQVYLQKTGNSVPAPNIRLVGFERVHIRVGETAVVSFTIEPEWHSVVYDGGSIL